MSEYTGKYDIPAVKQGNTWKGVRFRFEGIALANCTTKFTVAQSDGGKVVLETVPLIENNDVVVSPRKIDLAPAAYQYDLVIKNNTTGEVLTRMEGNWNIEASIGRL